VFNSRDLCLLEYLPALKKSGVTSVKIEGRMKSSYYVAVVTRVYRRMLDLLRNGPEPGGKTVEGMKNELTRVSHRGYTHGFIAGRSGTELQRTGDSAYIRNYQYVALVLESASAGKSDSATLLAVKDRISPGDRLLVMDPGGNDYAVTIAVILGEQGEPLACAHPGTRVRVEVGSGFLRSGQILHRPSDADCGKKTIDGGNKGFIRC
jgi:putative protease